MMGGRYGSWGIVNPPKQQANKLAWCPTELDFDRRQSVLPFGNGRSYGDSCLNSDGTLLDTQSLNRFISFDLQTGVLEAEPGVLLNDILQHVVPRGWFLPVTSGTSYVTLGGAIANDIHGKNHHCDGTIGRFVNSLEVLRSDGELLRCSAVENQQLFCATIGGLGLTGFITRISIRLMPIRSTDVDLHLKAFSGLEEFQALSSQYKNDYQYIVAWLDCASSGKNFGRGIFMAANHAKRGKGTLKAGAVTPKLGIPINFPRWVLNQYSIRAFNSLYFHKQKSMVGEKLTQHYQGFFYPLDAVGQWNRIYGAQGFYQYQFVVPLKHSKVLENILRDIVSSGTGSFLAVLKEFGDMPSPGLLSFPRPGLCLGLDFANRGVQTEKLIRRLDSQVQEAGGAAYPAKDRLMTADAFELYFEQSDKFSEYIDPAFSSDFWRRVSRQ